MFCRRFHNVVHGFHGFRAFLSVVQHAREAQQEASRRGVAGWDSDRVRSAPRRAPRLAMPRRRLLHYLGVNGLAGFLV